MPFPLAVGELEIPHAAGLGYVIAAELEAGGGTVVPGQGPEGWIPSAGLDADEQRALIRSLLHQADPRAIALGCRLGWVLQPEGIGPYFLSALVHHDTGVLMCPVGVQSVEEVLARAGAAMCPLDEAAWRALVLRPLRSAGAQRAEAAVLALYGTEEELAEWGPALLAGGDPAITAIFSEAKARPPVAALLGSAE